MSTRQTLRPVSSKKLARLSLIGIAASLGLTVRSNADISAELGKRVKAAYYRIHSYEATFQCDMEKVGIGRTKLQIDLKSSLGGKLDFRVRPTGVDGPLEARTRPLKMRITDDGKTGCIFLDALNQYAKGPHRADYRDMTFNFGVILGSDFIASPTLFNGGLVTRTQFAGRPAYALVPQNQPDPKGAGVLYFDQKSFRFLGMKARFDDNSNQIQIKTELVRDTINEPIPLSAFRSSIPAGAKQIAFAKP